MGMVIGGILCAVSGFLQFFPPDWRFVETTVHVTDNAMLIVGTFSYSVVELFDSVETISLIKRTAMNFVQLLGPCRWGALSISVMFSTFLFRPRVPCSAQWDFSLSALYPTYPDMTKTSVRTAKQIPLMEGLPEE